MCFVKDTLNGDNMIIAVDGMGGDNAPVEIVKGAVAASEQIPHRICILGPEEIIEEELKKYSYDKEKIFVRNTTQIIDNCDSPVRADPPVPSPDPFAGGDQGTGHSPHRR